MNRRRLAALAVLTVVIAIAAGAIAAGFRGTSHSPTGQLATEPPNDSIDRFFSAYVDPDGRVVRRDQGGDTVSEGQAYAMLLAVAVGDAGRFQEVWQWTKTHLQRADGLLSWRWRDGGVVDDQPATDADLDAASALIAAAGAFHRPELANDARHIAAGVLDHEVVSANGKMVLVAGPWAQADRIINPSYLARCGYDELATTTADNRWLQLGDDSAAILTGVTGDHLPPDWAIVGDDGTPQAIASPTDRSPAGHYGLDAERIGARLAVCSSQQKLVTSMWQELQHLADSGARVAYNLDGTPATSYLNPVGAIGAAGAARAAGDTHRVEEQLQYAEQLDQRTPTYYGAVWVALGETALGDTHDQLFQFISASRPLAANTEMSPAQATTTTVAATDPPTTAPTTVPPTTSPPLTTSPPTTVPPPTTGPSPTTTIAPPGATPTTSSVVGPGSAGTPPTSSSTGPTTVGAGATDNPSVAPPGSAGGGDLSAPSNEVAEAAAPPEQQSAPLERQRQRTTGTAAAAIGVMTVAGFALGLHERRVTRRKPTA